MKYIIIMLLLLVTPVMADTAYKNQEYVVWADIIQAGVYIPVTGANLTITQTNGTQILTNHPMTQVSTGVFNYPITINITGEYYADVVFYNNTGVVSRASATLQVREHWGPQLMNLAIILGIIAIITFLVYVGRDLLTKTADTVNKSTSKLLGIVLYMFAALIGLFIPYLLMIWSEGEAYHAVLRTMFIVLWVPIGMLIVVGILVVSVVLIYDLYVTMVGRG